MVRIQTCLKAPAHTDRYPTVGNAKLEGMTTDLNMCALISSRSLDDFSLIGFQPQQEINTSPA